MVNIFPIMATNDTTRIRSQIQIIKKSQSFDPPMKKKPRKKKLSSRSSFKPPKIFPSLPRRALGVGFV